MSGELGKASLDLEANLGPFERNLEKGHIAADRLDHTLEALASIADVCQKALNDIGIDSGQAARSRVSAEQILRGVSGISDESRTAAMEIDKVRVSEEQAAESVAAGDLIDHKLDEIRDTAERTQRSLDGVRLRLAAAGGGGGRRPGYGVGPFGAGYGRLGLVGTGIALGVATAPAVAPAALGLLGAIPGMAAAGAGALGTLALAFDGVGKAIKGDKKAFDDLGPSAQKFVLTIRSLDGFMDKLRQRAGGALFPGLTTGLRAALSPGTVSALEKAVTQIGKAIGSVGAEFGRYFGSREFQSIFGPLMASAARNIGVMGDAFLRLFDALGVLARAAIPFTNWLSSVIDKGAKLADTWIHAKDASGDLAHGMSEAEKSLRLVGGLALALVKVVIALGKVLYPVGKVVIKALTDGLDYLAGVLDRNRSTIQAIAGGALMLLIGAVKLAARGVETLYAGLKAVVGQKGIVIGAITAIGYAIAAALGPEGAIIVGALIAVGLIRNHWGQLVNFFQNIGRSIEYAFKYVWYILEKGALYAVRGIVEPFSHLPGVLGHWARVAKSSMQHQIDKLHPPNMDWRHYAAQAGAATGEAWTRAFNSSFSHNTAVIQQHAASLPPLPFSFWKRQHPGGTYKQYLEYVKLIKGLEQDTRAGLKHDHHRHHHDPSSADVFGKPPPFTTNLGTSKSAIPQMVSQLDAEAARQDQAAAALKYAGAKARKHLETEITDLEKADRILEEKIRHATGKKRTELYNALTRNLKKIAEARKRVGDAITKARQSELNFALDQAKLAVENAREGSKAWDKAIRAEEVALKAEIRYWARRAHNDKLSRDQRDAALRKEITYEKELKALLTQRNQAVAQNEAQFLSTFSAIQNAFAPNAFPDQPPSGSQKTDTHLHDIKQAARETAHHLKHIRRKHRHPGSQASHDAAMAVSG